jgi:hypothetical protein
MDKNCVELEDCSVAVICVARIEIRLALPGVSVLIHWLETREHCKIESNN